MCIKTFIKQENGKIMCSKLQKDRVAELVFIYPVGKVRQKQWQASLKLANPPILKHAGQLNKEDRHFYNAIKYVGWIKSPVKTTYLEM